MSEEKLPKALEWDPEEVDRFYQPKENLEGCEHEWSSSTIDSSLYYCNKCGIGQSALLSPSETKSHE